MASTEIVWPRLGCVVEVVVGGSVVAVVVVALGCVVEVVVGEKVVAVVVALGSAVVVGRVVVVVGFALGSAVVGGRMVAVVGFALAAAEPDFAVDPVVLVTPVVPDDVVDPVEPCVTSEDAVFCPEVASVVEREVPLVSLLRDGAVPPGAVAPEDPGAVVGGTVRDVRTRAEVHPETNIAIAAASATNRRARSIPLRALKASRNTQS